MGKKGLVLTSISLASVTAPSPLAVIKLVKRRRTYIPLVRERKRLLLPGEGGPGPLPCRPWRLLSTSHSPWRAPSAVYAPSTTTSMLRTWPCFQVLAAYKGLLVFPQSLLSPDLPWSPSSARATTTSAGSLLPPASIGQCPSPGEPLRGTLCHVRALLHTATSLTLLFI